MNGYKQKAAIALLGFSLALGPAGVLQAEERTFADVDRSHWGYDAIEWASERGIVDGYEDGTFRPDGVIDQMEFLAMLIRAYQPADFKPDDGGADWKAPYMNYAAQMGWKLAAPSSLGGHPTNRMTVTRGAVAQYLAGAAGKSYNMDDAIQFLLDCGLAKGKTDNSVEGYRKGDAVTRAEAVLFMERFRLSQPVLQAKPAGEQVYDRSGSQPIVYRDGTFGFGLTLPKSWEGRYLVKQEGKQIVFYDKATHDAELGGLLFGIDVWPEDAWQTDGEELTRIIRLVKLGESGGKVYAIWTPTDVQYSVDNDQLRRGYLDLFSDVKQIQASFVLPGK